MIKLQVISSRECFKALEKANFYIRRQTGSYIILEKKTFLTQIVKPKHNILDRSILKVIIKHSAISIDEFIKLL
ncbi:MAG: type II toxin-antitoxin system HicA family toxin [bacterium]